MDAIAYTTARANLAHTMNRVCNGVGCEEPVSSCATMSVAVCKSPGEPVTTTLWLPGS